MVDTSSNVDQCNVFVKYLPSELTDTGLYTLFAPFGTITSSKVMVDHNSGHSLGYGFVRFSTPQEAQNAIQNMNGQRISSKTLLCKLSNTSPTAQSPQNTEPSANLYVKPLLPDTSEDQLRAMFAPFGSIAECKVMVDKQTGVSRQIGFVRFENQEDADRALHSMNGTKLEANAPPLIVKYAESETQKLMRRQRQITAPPPPLPRGGNNSAMRNHPSLAYRHIPVGSQGSSYGHQQPVHVSMPQGQYMGEMYPVTYMTPSQHNPYTAPAPTPPMATYPPAPNAHPHHIVAVPPGSAGSAGSQQPDGVNLFVFHLPTEVDDAFLYRLFSPFGALESVKVITDKNTGESKGYGFVKYFRMSDAMQSIQAMNGFQVGTKHLKVSFKTGGPGIRTNM
mmetsp:Transcript_8293/g.13509  ORF Transcript_8293/g.13509 Transcript_8293/m.13509 type:complete len:393 (-) Transcript_8293:163-1341(-)|eukprot:CAMPEP_0184643612 /NCGR_PEP_ID=MMETSP0308-20130426/441_1 /TAXON_ID=38269 /ORGANISM="Gloeochaete witrockiana, Strain SAG 46.84" /LENGTH=392 /DNA_ID=CAMNT_0027071655 /DNA_START=215 /DNA_END=1393 /DNA_ORIENTATION=+